MHSLRAQFVLLATTFATAVLANPMNAAHTRRDSAASSNATDLANAISSASSSVQLVSRNISSAASDSGKQTFLDNFSTASHDVESLDFFLTLFKPFGEDDSQKLVNETLISFFLTLNDTTNAIKPDFTDGLSPLEFSGVVASFTNLITGADALQAAMTRLLTQNATEQLNPVSSSVTDNLESTMLSLEVSFEKANNERINL